MSPEVLVVLFKYGWIPVSGWFLWLKQQDKIKLDNTYTKEETKEQIKSHIDPLKTSHELKHQNLEEKLNSIQSMLTILNSQRQEDKEKSDAKDAALLEVLSKMQTSIAVIESKIDKKEK
tara:strand:- start:11745 stop:12101 length:357 start_codon:yes stop_codon:yes gene_type:complete